MQQHDIATCCYIA